jgi:hypothetical protein
MAQNREPSVVGFKLCWEAKHPSVTPQPDSAYGEILSPGQLVEAQRLARNPHRQGQLEGCDIFIRMLHPERVSTGADSQRHFPASETAIGVSFAHDDEALRACWRLFQRVRGRDHNDDPI